MGFILFFVKLLSYLVVVSLKILQLMLIALYVIVQLFYLLFSIIYFFSLLVELSSQIIQLFLQSYDFLIQKNNSFLWNTDLGLFEEVRVGFDELNLFLVVSN